MKRILACAAVAAASMGASALAGTMVLTFEGLQNVEAINGFYNGGTGSLGSVGTDFGVEFSMNTLAVIDADSGGTGNFANEPSEDTIMFFLTGGVSTMNVAAGFETGFSFFYTSLGAAGSVSVWDDLNGAGNLLGTINLVALGSGGSGDPTGDFDTWAAVGVAFAGTAYSITFAGVDNQIGFDNITFGSDTPGTGIPLPTAGALGFMGITAVGARRRRMRA